jgi:hypothetical protein
MCGTIAGAACCSIALPTFLIATCAFCCCPDADTGVLGNGRSKRACSRFCSSRFGGAELVRNGYGVTEGFPLVETPPKLGSKLPNWKEKGFCDDCETGGGAPEGVSASEPVARLDGGAGGLLVGGCLATAGAPDPAFPDVLAGIVPFKSVLCCEASICEC